jgi:K+-sensing histidine kinase KdpD
MTPSVSAVSYVEESLRWDSDILEEVPTLVGLINPVSEESAHILVVDDNADMRDYLRRLLEQRYVVETVKDGVAALKAINHRLPDLVVSDVMMPSRDGFALLQQLRGDPTTQIIPIILLSARTGEEARIEGLEAGADDYLVKPFSARELLARINAQLAMARLRRNLLTNEQLARAEAENANLLKLKFLGMVSHELRTPLASIKGFATTLIADDVTFTPDEQRQFASIISEEADKLTDLVDHLLDLSRLQAGTLRIEVVPVTPQSIIDSAFVELQQLTTNHHLMIEIPPDSPRVKADPHRIAQVIVNLVNNAVKFSPSGTKIGLQAHSDDTVVQFDVSDEGSGIPIEKRESVFEAFRQLEMSSISQRKGAGLGLAICKGIIEAHQGTIWIQEHTSPGTMVSFTLPIAFTD